MSSFSIKNTSYLELWLMVVVVISFFLFCLYLSHIDSPEKYVPIVTAIAAAYAPFGAWKIAEKWREQKQFDLRKNMH